MTMERWIAGQKEKGNKAAVAMGRTLLSQFGEVPLEEQHASTTAKVDASVPPINIETLPKDLKKESIRQAQQLAYLFAELLGMSRNEYIETYLPTLFRKPRNYRGKFEMPLIVQPEVPGKLSLQRMMQLVGLEGSSNSLNIRERDTSIKTPTAPYSTWVHLDVRDYGSPRVECSELIGGADQNTRFGRTIDGIAYFINHRAEFGERRVGTILLLGDQGEHVHTRPELNDRDYHGRTGITMVGSRSVGAYANVLTAGTEMRTRS